jgi:hypothetical protein
MTRLDAVFPFLPAPCFPSRFISFFICPLLRRRIPIDDDRGSAVGQLACCGAMTYPPSFFPKFPLCGCLNISHLQSRKKQRNGALAAPTAAAADDVAGAPPLLPLSEPAKIAGCPDSKRSTEAPRSRRTIPFRSPGVRSSTVATAWACDLQPLLHRHRRIRAGRPYLQG